MSFVNIVTELGANGVATVTVNRPRQLNALSSATVAELRQAFAQFRDDPQVKVVILTGAGDRAFVAGADISEMVAMGALEFRRFATEGQALMRDIEGLGKPVVAAINGYALGGGLELAMACDIRIASETARLGQPEINLGIIPGFGGTQRLPRLVGRGKALEMVMTGEQVDASEAHRIGLVNAVVPAERFREWVAGFADKLAGKASVALGLAKAAVLGGLDVALESGCALERELSSLCFATEDQKEGMKAFLEKRKPEFRGR